MSLDDCIVISSEMLQYFPQPSKPTDACKDIMFKSTMSENRSSLLEEEQQEGEENVIDEDGILQLLKECLRKVDEKERHDSLKKLVSKSGNHIPLVFKEALQDSTNGDSHVSHYVEKLRGILNHGARDDRTSKSRDVDFGLSSESSTKMDRFKVKALNLGGLVKQEQK